MTTSVQLNGHPRCEVFNRESSYEPDDEFLRLIAVIRKLHREGEDSLGRHEKQLLKIWVEKLKARLE